MPSLWKMKMCKNVRIIDHYSLLPLNPPRDHQDDFKQRKKDLTSPPIHPSLYPSRPSFNIILQSWSLWSGSWWAWISPPFRNDSSLFPVPGPCEILLLYILIMFHIWTKYGEKVRFSPKKLLVMTMDNVKVNLTLRRKFVCQHLLLLPFQV